MFSPPALSSFFLNGFVKSLNKIIQRNNKTNLTEKPFFCLVYSKRRKWTRSWDMCTFEHVFTVICTEKCDNTMYSKK